MSMTSTIPVLFLLVCIILYIIAIVYLSKKSIIFWGLILPAISGDIALYNYIKPMLVYNPYPTMTEVFYMIFFGAMSILGFIVFAITRFMHRDKSNIDS